MPRLVLDEPTIGPRLILDEPVTGTSLRDPAVEEQQIKETLDLSEQYKVPPIEAQQFVAGPEPSAFGKLLGKVKDLANEWILRPEQIPGETERWSRAGKEMARGGLAVSAEATSKLSLGALDVITNKTVGDRSLADLVLRVTDQRAMSPEEKAKAETLGYLPAFVLPGMAVRKGLSYVPARQFLKTILGAGLTFGSTDLALQESRKLVTGEPIDWQGVHFQGGAGVLFGFGEVAVAAALTGIAKGIEKYWGEKGIELASKIRPEGRTLEEQVIRQEAEVRADIERAKQTFRETGKMPDDLMEKYVYGKPKEGSALVEKIEPKAETPAQPIAKAPSVPVAGQRAETGAIPGAEGKVTLANYDQLAKPIQDAIDTRIDELVTSGKSVQEAMNDAQVEKLTNKRFALDQQAIQDYRDIVRSSLEGVGITDDTLTFTPALSIGEDIYGAPRRESKSHLIGMVYEHGQEALSNEVATKRKLAEKIFRYQAEKEGLDPEGILGPASSLTEAGKKARLLEAAKLAERVHESIKRKLGPALPAPAAEALGKGEGEKAEGPARDILGGVEPIQQINKALKEAREKRPLLEAERKTELKRRVAAAAGFVKGKLGKGEFGEKTGQISTGLLKGELSNQRYESIREKMEESMPGAVRNAVASIWNADYSYFDALDIDTAFQKLLDGIPITLRQADLIAKHFGAEMGEIAKTRAEVSSLADRAYTLWRANLLTGLKSWGPASINMLSNLAHGVTEVGKDYISAPADIVASWFTGKREVGLTVKGIPSGMKEGAQKGWDYLKTGIEERPIAEKFDLPRDRINFGDSKTGKLLQIYVDTTFHVYGAEDQPFFYGAMAHSIRSQAIASGRTKKLKGTEFDTHVDGLVKNPTESMLENAVMDAEQAVFQNETMLGDIARIMQKVPVVRWLVPFSRTPSAVATQIVNYTPVGLVKEIVDEIHKGKFNQRKFVQAFGRAGLGTGALFIGALLVKVGIMTLGYPKNERERKLWELEGRKENSIKIGGKWRSVFVLGPVGNVLLIGGYFQQALEESGSPSEAIVTAMSGGAKSLTEQTFVQGMSQAIDAAKDPERSFDRFFSSMAGSAVPTILADMAKATDEIERKATGPWERIASRLPGLRQTLEPRVDVFGQDLPRYGGNPFEVMLDSTRPVKIRQDVVVDEIRRLWDKDVRVAPTELGNRDGYKILTSEENTVLWRRSGQLTYRGLFDLIQQPYYKTLSDEAKGKQIEKEVKKAKDLARAEVAKIKLNQGHTMEELREDGLVIEDVEKLINIFEIKRK